MINKLKHKNHICNTTELIANQTDPSRTTTLRRAFSNDLLYRFNAIRGLIRIAIIEEDVFGLTPIENKAVSGRKLAVDSKGRLIVINESPAQRRARRDRVIARLTTPGPGAFAFDSSARKVSQFMDWLDSQVKLGLLDVVNAQQVGDAVDAAWSNTYINDAYQRGVIRARTQLRRAGMDIPPLSQTTIAATMSTPFHVDRVGILFTRTYNELKGITDWMDQSISRVLAQGFAEGAGPREIAAAINKVITGAGGDLALVDSLGRFIPATRRAQMLARTEIIRAHAHGQLQEFQNWGIVGVNVKAEFVTAGDRRVCPDCLALEGQTFSMDRAYNIIPVHPSCRCIWIPVLS